MPQPPRSSQSVRRSIWCVPDQVSQNLSESVWYGRIIAPCWEPGIKLRTFISNQSHEATLGLEMPRDTSYPILATCLVKLNGTVMQSLIQLCLDCQLCNSSMSQIHDWSGFLTRQKDQIQCRECREASSYYLSHGSLWIKGVIFMTSWAEIEHKSFSAFKKDVWFLLISEICTDFGATIHTKEVGDYLPLGMRCCEVQG